MKLRVLYVTPDFGLGGAERRAVDIIKHLDPERFDIAAVSLYGRKNTSFEAELDRANATIWYLNKRPGPQPQMLSELDKIVSTFEPQIIHSHLYVMRYVLPVALRRKSPIRLHTICNQPKYEVDRVGRLIHRFAFRYGRITPISLSESLRTELQGLYGPVESPVIYSGVDTKKFKLDKNESSRLRTALGLDGKTIILHIGRFSPQKNHELLLKAFAKVALACREAVLLLVGDGALRPKIEASINQLGLSDRVLLLGQRSDTPQLLAAADMLVLASDWEGVPRVLLEAMAAGRPAIATRVGGVPEVLRDNITGYLVPPRDIDSLANAMLELARTPQLARRLGEAALSASQSFDIHNMVSNYQSLYMRLWDNYALMSNYAQLKKL